MDNLQIPFTLTLAEINAILNLLVKAPFEVAAPLINKIKAQADPVLAAEQKRQQDEQLALAQKRVEETTGKANEAIQAAARATGAPVPPKRPNRAARRAAEALNGGADGPVST